MTQKGKVESENFVCTIIEAMFNKQKRRTMHQLAPALRKDWWRSPALWAGCASFLVPLALYVKTLAPTVTLEDSGTFIAAAYHLGVAHPPGYPLWCLLAHLFTMLPIGSIAQQVHLCSAFFAAATSWMVFCVAWRLTRRWTVSLTAALALGFSRVMWSQAVIAEVYTLNAFLIILAFYFVIRWREQYERRWLYYLSLTIGLGLTNHTLFGLIAPVFAAWVIIPHWRKAFQPKVIITCALLLLAGLSLYLYLPIRARANPPVNWGNPNTIAKTLSHIRRDAYQTETEQVRYAGKSNDIAKHCLEAFKDCGETYAWLLVCAALAGAGALMKKRLDVLLAALAIVILNIIVLNISLKAMATPRLFFVFRVYYIPTHIMISILAAAGCARLLEWSQRHSRAWLLATYTLMTLCVLLPLAANYHHNDRSNYKVARNFGLDYLDSMPKNSGLLALSDEVTFVCFYLTSVEGLRPDIHILDTRFGWRGESVSAVMSEVPVSSQLLQYFPFFNQAASVPCGLGYWLINEDQVPPVNFDSLQPLPHPTRHPRHPLTSYDPFEVDIRALYSNYHARLGAKLLCAGDLAGAQYHFTMSEFLKDQDAYAHYLLATIYDHLGINTNRVEAMLEKAAVLLEQHYDPADYRFYPITGNDIARELDRVRRQKRFPAEGDTDSSARQTHAGPPHKGKHKKKRTTDYTDYTDKEQATDKMSGSVGQFVLFHPLGKRFCALFFPKIA